MGLTATPAACAYAAGVVVKPSLFTERRIHAGPSGDFFGYDSSRKQIVRVSPQAKLVEAYSLEGAGLKTVTKLARFLVWEPGGTLLRSLCK